MKKNIKLVTLMFGFLMFFVTDYTVIASVIDMGNEIIEPIESTVEPEGTVISEDIKDKIEKDTEEKEEDVENDTKTDLDLEVEGIYEQEEVEGIDEQAEVTSHEEATDQETSDAELSSDKATNTNSIQTMSLNKQDNYNQIISRVSVQYYAQVRPKNDGIYTKPKGMKDSILYTSYKLNWQDVLIVEEAATNSGVFAKLVQIDTGQEIGWINKVDLALYDTLLRQDVNEYYAQVRPTNRGIFTSPEGTYNSVLYTSYRYNWKDIKIIEEAVTSSGTHSLLVELDSNRTIGWINKNDLAVYNTIYNSIPVQYYGTINTSNTGIYTKPRGSINSILYTSYKYNSKAVRVLEEAQTDNGVFIKVESIDENRVLGWINKNDVNVMDDVYINRNPVEKFAVVNSFNQGIYTEPQGSFDSILYTSYLFNNKAVKVVEEADTIVGKYSKLQRIEDNSLIGWIRSNEVTNTNFIKSSSTKNLYGKVKLKNEGIFTEPYGDFDSILYTSYLYNNKDVKISEETNTLTGHFYKISDVNDNRVLGWIKSKDISVNEDIKNISPLNNYGIVKPNNDGIYTLPKGMKDAILYTSYVMNGQDVRLIEEAEVGKTVFVKLAQINNGNSIGWIRKSDVDFYDTVRSATKQDYRAKVSSSNQGIYTSPKGTYGAILYTSYLFNNKDVKVVEEAVTSSGVFAKLARIENNTTIGWIRKDDLITTKVIYLDPGHGGNPSKGGNPGAVYNGVREQDLNLTISLKVRDELEKLGYQVVMAREDGNNSYANGWRDDLYARPAHANKIGADILVSVHHNASGIWDSSMNGIETYVYIPKSSNPPLPENDDSHDNPLKMSESRKLANAIHKDLISNTGANDRGVKDGAFVVVREAEMPAVLLELGFMSNRAELNKLTTTSYQQKLVNGIVSGIHNYFLI